VERGVPIATVGTSGLSTGPHLHYEVLVHGRQVDPLRFKMAQPVTDAAPSPAAAPAPAVVQSGTPVIPSANAPTGAPAAAAPNPSTSSPRAVPAPAGAPQ
jgi:hypothetical protein